MKPPNMAPVYVMLWERATEIARSCGYALAIHGTLGRDIDLLACPWTDEAVSAEELADRIGQGLAWIVVRSGENEERPHLVGPEHKAHGRLAWSLPYMGEWQIDLSVMPRAPTTPRSEDGGGKET